MRELAAASDAELVRLVCAGQREWFAQLVRRHERLVYRLVQGILDNTADAEEVLQESFLKAFEHIQEFRGESQFRTWLIRIATNEAKMRLRKYRSKLHDSLDEPADDASDFRPRDLRDWRPDAEQKLASAELRGLLERAIRALPRPYREVLLLRDVEHFSSAEAAVALGISISAAKTRLLRARLMMREYLTPHFRSRWRHRLLDRSTARGRLP